MTYSFPDLEPVCCSMSSSNCCFLTCLQISQDAGQEYWSGCHFLLQGIFLTQGSNSGLLHWQEDLQSQPPEKPLDRLRISQIIALLQQSFIGLKQHIPKARSPKSEVHCADSKVWAATRPRESPGDWSLPLQRSRMGGLTTPVSACLLIAFSFVHNLPLFFFFFFLTKHFIAKKKKKEYYYLSLQ